MIPNIVALLAASAECRAIFGTPPQMRVYPFEAKQDKRVPYLVWQMPSITPQNYLGQLPDVDDARLQIDFYVAEQSDVELALDAIRAAIAPHADETNSAARPRDATTRHYGMMMEFLFQTDR